MSKRLLEHTSLGLKFNLIGPCGKGLITQTSGLHVAICAGTGVLTFMDLVARLVQSALSPNPQNDEFRKFRLELYASFPSEDEAIGYELCYNFNKYCKQNDLKLFRFHTRFRNKRISTNLGSSVR